jgi:glutathionylspermidine synthase
MILSNKAILPVLWELFPDSAYLLPAGFEPEGDDYVVKPIYSREGSNIAIVNEGSVIAETDGDYTEGPRVYQRFQPLPSYEGRYPVVGSWIINGHACGIGIREDDGLITRNTSRFVPHLFRKKPAAKSPAMDPKCRSTGPEPARRADGSADPLWDPWLDR